MSPEVVRLLAVATVSLLAGGALGGYATNALLDGGQDRVRPMPVPPPPALQCNCETPQQAAVDPLGAGRIPDDLTEVAAPALPGLPVSALNRARAAAQQVLRPCATSSTAFGQGTLILTLTVTATGGQGFIREAAITGRTGDVSWAEECVMRRTRQVRFDWSGSDGQQTLKLPLQVGDL